MSHYKEIPTTLLIADLEMPCTYSFDYQPAEKSWFNPRKGEGSPGCGEAYEITEIYVEPKPGIFFDLMSDDFNWLLSDDIVDDLKEDAAEYLLVAKNEQLL